MNLYLYDGKHEKILGTFHINEQFNDKHFLNELSKIIQFLEKNKIPGKYCELVIAQNYSRVVREVLEDSYMDFHGVFDNEKSNT